MKPAGQPSHGESDSLGVDPALDEVDLELALDELDQYELFLLNEPHIGMKGLAESPEPPGGDALEGGAAHDLADSPSGAAASGAIGVPGNQGYESALESPPTKSTALNKVPVASPLKPASRSIKLDDMMNAVYVNHHLAAMAQARVQASTMALALAQCGSNQINPLLAQQLAALEVSNRFARVVPSARSLRGEIKFFDSAETSSTSSTTNSPSSGFGMTRHHWYAATRSRKKFRRRRRRRRRTRPHELPRPRRKPPP